METYKSKYSRKELEEKILSLTGGVDLTALQQQVANHEDRIKKLEDDLKNINSNPGNGGNCACNDPGSQINQEINNIKNEINKIKNIILGKTGTSTKITRNLDTFVLNPDYHYNVIENFGKTDTIRLDDFSKMENGQELYVFAMTSDADKKVKVYFPGAKKIVNPQGEIITANVNGTNATTVTAVSEMLEISIIKLSEGTFIRMA